MSNRLAFQTQLASIMEVLANAAVAEICKLVDDDYAVVSLQMSQCQRENKDLKRKLHLLELKMARGNAERRLRDSAWNGGRTRVQVNNSNDRLRIISPSPAGKELERQVNLVLWPERTPGDISNVKLTCSDNSQKEHSNVELVLPERVLVKEKIQEMDMEVRMFSRDDDLLEGELDFMYRRATGQRANENGKTKDRSNGLESRNTDPMIVKVEHEEEASGNQSQADLSIQEELVESSTDDNKDDLQLNETASQVLDVQESSQSFSEVSFFNGSSWTDAVAAYNLKKPLTGQPSNSTNPTVEQEFGSCGREGVATVKSRSFGPPPPFVSTPIIDLCNESEPAQVPEPTLSNPCHASFHGYRPNSLTTSSVGKGGQQHVLQKRKCVCSFCGKTFRSPANLESHLRTHTGERPYGCNICGKTFSQFWNLKIHRNTHTGERPYPCQLCPGRFSDPSNLKKHVKRHHPLM